MGFRRKMKRASIYWLTVLAVVTITVLVTLEMYFSKPRKIQKSPTDLSSTIASKFHRIFHLDVISAKKLERLIDTATAITKNSNPLLVTLVNNAFVPFMVNWLCHTKHMNIHKNLLVVTMDIHAKEKLENLWPYLKVVSLERNDQSKRILWGQRGYYKLVAGRSAVLSALVTSGFELVSFDADAVWFQNPLPEVLTMGSYDIISGQSSRLHDYALNFMYINNTFATRHVFDNLITRLASVLRMIDTARDLNLTAVQKEHNDQRTITEEINRCPGIRTLKLDFYEYTVGKWYKSRELQQMAPRPKMIQSNWVLFPTKIPRAKKWHHWFVKNDLTCDISLVKKAVYDFDRKY